MRHIFRTVLVMAAVPSQQRASLDSDGDMSMARSPQPQQDGIMIDQQTRASQRNNVLDVDEALYSRQLYVFGREAQHKLTLARVLIVGLGGLGVEIAKNIILAGVGAVGLLDQEVVTVQDLAAQFYLRHEHVGKVSRAKASVEQLRTLNSYVDTYVIEEKLSLEMLKKEKFDVVVITKQNLNKVIEIDEYCNAHGIKCIVADIHGAFGAIFVDFGKHCIVDIDGEQPRRGLIVHVSSSDPGVVTCHEESRHGMQDGDYVTFEEVEGMVELNNSPARPIKVISPFSFSIENTTSYSPYTGSRGYFQQVKQNKNVQFKPLREQLANPSIIDDFFCTSYQLHALYQALSEFQIVHKMLPRAHINAHISEVVQIAERIAKQHNWDTDSKFLHKAARGASAEITTIASALGGIAAQEALKAISGKFGPIQQFYYLDATASLPDGNVSESEFLPENTRYDHQIAVYGRSLSNRIRSLSWFVVGAGAIGCEMLKTFALLGIGSMNGGQLFVTDMDTIEKSNLNRQFLFRPGDVGKLKSVSAAREAMKINPEVKIIAKDIRVAPQTENVYNEAFWERLNGVSNALDNVEARLYVDQRCVYFQKPLIDSGTLGPKGSTQVVVPFLTESYGSSRDPPEESIPICTLRNFPNKIEHTIQWARDLFEGWFKQAPEDVNAYLSKPDYLNELASQPNIQLEKLEIIKAYLVDRPLSFEHCVVWARLKFEDEFNHKIKQLLYNFPSDAKTSEGALFWSGPKRAPTPIDFNSDDPSHLNFIVAAANLRAFNYGLRGESDLDFFYRVLKTVKVPPFKPIQVKIATTDAEAQQMSESDTSDDLHDQKVRELRAALPNPKHLAGFRLRSAEFEKDDDTNFHIDFITSASNMRARNYAIKEADRHQTKGIAGKIIPAIATTTALVTGLACIEIFKLQQAKPIEAFRNYAINLALPLFSASEPLPPASTTAKIKTGEWKWTLWDRIDVDIGPTATLQQLVDHMLDKYGLEISMLSHGASLLFSSFVPPKKAQERLATPIVDLVKRIGKYDINPDEHYLILEPSVTYVEEDLDVDVPFIRFKIA